MMNDDQSMRDRALTDAGENGRKAPIGQPVTGPAARSEDEPEVGGSDGPSAQRSAASAADKADWPDNADGADDTRRRRRSFWRELPILVVVALVIALLIKTFVVQAFFIPSSSMENTLEIGDKVLVNKLVYHFRKIEPGDVVVFNGAGSWDPVQVPAPASSDPVVRLYDATLGRLLHSISGLFGTVPGQTDYIKRVIGVPGDRVACCTGSGLVTVNGVPLQESSYLFPGAKPSLIRFHMTVPAGRLWVMGDNRFVSDDSRLHGHDPGVGTIPENKVIGRAFLIVWPPGRWRILPIPATFGQSGVHRPGAASARSAASGLSAGVTVAPSSPLLPLAAGFAGAVPLTWLGRRLRRRRRPGHR